MNRNPNRREYLRCGITLLLGCLLLWQQVALAAHGCAWPTSAGPDTVQLDASPHATDCDNNRAACLQHCGPDASRSHEAGLYLDTHFPTAITPDRAFLQLQDRLTGALLSAGLSSTPPVQVPARLLFCSLQI